MTRNLTLTLDDRWRRKGDISWRVTSWDLRRMATGGLLLKPTTPEARKKANLADDQLALFVEHVGQYNEHAVAKRAGFRKGDIIVEFDGRSDAMRETDLFAYVLRKRMPGARVPVTVVRDGKRIEMMLRMQ